MSAEIFVVPFFGQGHLFPCMELCKHLASRNFKATLVISSNLASSVPSSLREYPLVRIAEIPSSPSPSPSPPPPPPQPGPGSHPPHASRGHDDQSIQGIETLLSLRPDDPHQTRPVCAIIDIMMNWSADVFKRFQVPTVAFFTTGACSAALEHATWKAHSLGIKPGEIGLLPGLPEDMAVTDTDLKQRPRGPPPNIGGGPPPHGSGAGFPPPAGPPGGPPTPPHGSGAGFPPPPGPPGGPPKAGDQPRWVEEVSKTSALMINTCEELERPFLDYIANQIEKPVWGPRAILEIGRFTSSRPGGSIGPAVQRHRR